MNEDKTNPGLAERIPERHFYRPDGWEVTDYLSKRYRLGSLWNRVIEPILAIIGALTILAFIYVGLMQWR